MNKKLRRAVVAGNWKMNLCYDEAICLIETIKKKISNPDCEVVLCTAGVYLTDAVKQTRDTCLNVGAQDVSAHESGAYTGEISARQLKSVGVEYAIIGHSERRWYHNETNEAVNAKVHALRAQGLTPIMCVGETLSQREGEKTSEVITTQVTAGLLNITPDDMKNIVIAYEPVWAIGTGKTATAEQADEGCAIIRNAISSIYSEEIAQSISILYGGSMNASNARTLLSMENVDGGLIGGAALKADDFIKIVEAAN